jgi:hypothetical protein
MNSGIKITGLIKSGGQQIVIDKSGKMAAEDAINLSNIVLFSL